MKGRVWAVGEGMETNKPIISCVVSIKSEMEWKWTLSSLFFIPFSF